MVRLREISRTAVFAWSPGSQPPLLVTGTRAGAVSDDFSSDVKLELWDLKLDQLNQGTELSPAGSLTVDAGFNDIAWSEPTDEHPLGVIAGALDNGAVVLWDADKLRKGGSKVEISATTKHSGAAKALQFNPIRHNLLASVGSKGEIFVYDVNNMASPFRLGATAARADDIECLDWNKSEKTAHILATGSSGGFVTVWDVKQKREILTLNNSGRKAVSAVAWDPEESTKLATASPNDQEPAIFLWSLRNSSAPERTLKGHELGVLSLSWCAQDPELLLSCGKDNRTICWNPRTGEMYGDFAAGSNWAFQTKWNPHNPGLIASASFDGKILITSIQSTNSATDQQSQASQTLDNDDFFAKAQSQPQSITFSLPKAPKWAGRACTASFGFGGKIVRVINGAVKIDTFEVDSAIGEGASVFDGKLRSGDLSSICASKIEEAKTDEEKADWRVIETLNAGKSRKKLREYLGFDDQTDAELADGVNKLAINGDAPSGGKGRGTSDDADDFFGNGDSGDSFLADLAASKGAKTNNPFSIYTGKESDADKQITRSLMLGQFEKALDVALKADRMSDAFMIAVCGGQTCIDKAQNAYLKKKAQGPNYLRLLASIVGKNLWDVVHNADLANWKDVMATLCTYADGTEFSDLCEALGDRLEEAFQQGSSDKNLRRDASFCYLAGAKLEKVVINWVQELHEQEESALSEADESENSFSVHSKCLRDFIEKVSVFRAITKFQDVGTSATSDWKLAPLYSLYAEYAEILAAHGKLLSAQQYIDLLPMKFEGAESAQQRVRQATAQASSSQRQPAATTQRAQARPSMTPQPFAPAAPAAPLMSAPANAPTQYMPTAPAQQQSPVAARNQYAPSNPIHNAYQPAGYQQQQGAPYGGYAPPQQMAMPPPPQGRAASPSAPPPSASKNMTNWNDMPENFVKQRQPNSRRSTPGPQPVGSPFPNSQPATSQPPPPGPNMQNMQRTQSPLPPPPKAGEAPPRVTSPLTAPPQNMTRPSPSAASNMYAPPQQPISSPPPVGSTLPTPSMPPPQHRGSSPYQPPPSTSSAAPSSRYAPAPGTVQSPAPGMPPPRNVAPNPYAATPPLSNPYGPNQQQQQYQSQQPYGQAPPMQAPSPAGPPPQGPPRGAPPRAQAPPAAPPPQGPPRAAPQPAAQPPPQAAVQAPPQAPASDSRPSTSQSSGPPTRAKYPKGDRSHVPATAQPIVNILTPEINRIKGVAPEQFKKQVDDMEKRLNILFDHLNNEDLLSEGTVAQMVEISRAVESRDWDEAQRLFGVMQAEKQETEGGLWILGVKRLLAIGKATKS